LNRYESACFVYHGPQDVQREKRFVSCPKDGLLLKIRTAGLCSTDRSVYRNGHPKVDPHVPVILGHELCGEIVAKGAEVGSCREGVGYLQGEQLNSKQIDFPLGQRVTLQSRIARYANGLMLTKDPLTILSFSIDGGYAQYMVVPDLLIRSGSVLRIPDHVSDVEGALVEPAACALEALFSTPHPIGVDKEGRHLFRTGVKRGGLACIIGSGTLAMIYARLCLMDGAAKVFVLVRSQEKAQRITRLIPNRVQAVVVPRYDRRPLSEKMEIEKDIVQKLDLLTEGHLFDDVVLACADPDAQRLMLELYTPEGYAVGSCFAGLRRRSENAHVDLNHYRTAITMGTSGCSTATMETALNRIAQGELAVGDLVSPAAFDLDDDPHRFFTAKTDGLKAMLYPHGKGAAD